ncbi:MAG: 16S rRNA (cytosine(1402)-N(4))-methyltransferase [Candidatus Melainabacteria bacterium]|nr:MAG: 16S rRNA (cytosine(1402)-N(4))-methyltransferase [Candidatus Melainabacteria bacterium]
MQLLKQGRIKKIETTFDLNEIIKKAIPITNGRIHYATRVYQALRIEVNNELKNIKQILYKIVPFLKVGGIISVLSFHSLEDKIVKTAFKEMSKQCRCELNKPICTCGGAIIKSNNKKTTIT